MTDKQQQLRLGKSHPNLSPPALVLLRDVFYVHSLLTNDFLKKSSVKLYKFTDDTAVVCDAEESVYRQEGEQLAILCSTTSLS